MRRSQKKRTKRLREGLNRWSRIFFTSLNNESDSFAIVSYHHSAIGKRLLCDLFGLGSQLHDRCRCRTVLVDELSSILRLVREFVTRLQARCRSVARAEGSNALGIILAGMGSDGTQICSRCGMQVARQLPRLKPVVWFSACQKKPSHAALWSAFFRSKKYRCSR